jgi:hypothetical protein
MGTITPYYQIGLGERFEKHLTNFYPWSLSLVVSKQSLFYLSYILSHLSKLQSKCKTILIPKLNYYFGMILMEKNRYKYYYEMTNWCTCHDAVIVQSMSSA